jgi:hypothetical protein
MNMHLGGLYFLFYFRFGEEGGREFYFILFFGLPMCSHQGTMVFP